MKAVKYANVIVDITHEKLDKTFQYKISDELEDKIYPGVQALVPFGKGNRLIKCYVIEVTDTPQYDESRLKYIRDVVQESIPIETQLIKVASWMKKYYGSTMNRALKTVIPVSKKIKEIKKEYITLAISKDEVQKHIEKFSCDKRMKSRVKLLEELTVSENIASEKTGVSKNVIQSLEKMGIINICHDTVYRTPEYTNDTIPPNITLNECQKKVASDIINEIKNPEGKRTHLIFGVTGSGKTQVYMECIDSVIESGKQVILLIPEISLTYQNLNRFYQRYGDRVSVMNSRLSQGERYDRFEMAKDGKIDIMIGPRSALFTPFSNLGLIIIDEEHENAYKAENTPKYHARETAVMRAGLTDATVILGSATPSVEAFYKAQNGEYMLHKMMKRVNDMPLPKVHVVDLREELKAGNKSVFSVRMAELIADRLKKKEQTILFVNRRGYAGFVSCRSCGKTLKCPHCDVSLTYHKEHEEIMECHYCGYSIKKPDTCPFCGSKYLGKFGIGTQSVQEKIKKLFPEARVLRMDMDTTKGKEGHQKILSAFSKGEADILVGTQMIVKGHDIQGVTLVGVIAADLSLYASDYRAAEKTFELLTQAAGRAGRGHKTGEVVIQTYNPEEYSIMAAAKQDYEEFYRQELIYRKMMKYPPAYNMAAILFSSKNEELCKKCAEDVAGRINNSKLDNMTVIGATRASISKINDIYRYVIYIKHQQYDMLIHVKDGVEKYIDMVHTYKTSVNIQFDFTPMDYY